MSPTTATENFTTTISKASALCGHYITTPSGTLELSDYFKDCPVCALKRYKVAHDIARQDLLNRDKLLLEEIRNHNITRKKLMLLVDRMAALRYNVPTDQFDALKLQEAKNQVWAELEDDFHRARG